MPEVLKGLVSSRRFWLALLAVVITVLQQFGLNPQIVQAIQVFAAALIGAYTVEDAAAALKG